MRSIFVILAVIAWPWHAAFADATTEAELRAALQHATAQIATLEDQVANLQASQAPDQAIINAQQAQIQTLKQQGQKGGAASIESVAQNAAGIRQLAALNERVSTEQAELGKAMAAYEQAANAANTNAAADQRLTAQLNALQASNKSCQTKNIALYQTGNQILDAYAHKDDLWGAIDKEPFIGIERVKLQNTVQDDQDRLDDNQVNP